MRIPFTRQHLAPVFFVIAAPLLLSFVLVASSGSMLLAKKVVATLLLPTGIVWLGLLALVFWPGMRKWLRMVIGGIWILYTLAGNVWVGSWLFGHLEADALYSVTPKERYEGNYDAVFVLGGGTARMGDGSAGLGPSGDRVLEAARLYLKGRTPVLVASGQSVTELGDPRSLAAETKEIWMDLEVPESAIIELPNPRNTREEIAAYAELIGAKGWGQVGMISSAWHLPRAEAIAEEAGIRMISIPSDFRSGKIPSASLFVIPQAKGFHAVQTALWEYLGRIGG